MCRAISSLLLDGVTAQRTLHAFFKTGRIGGVDYPPRSLGVPVCDGQWDVEDKLIVINV